MGRTTQRECGTTGRRGPDKERPVAWNAYGKLVRLFRERVGLTRQALAEAIDYSLEQVVSVEVQAVVNIRSDRNEVSEFCLPYRMLRSQAPNIEESARFIEHLAGEL